jgi:hypothetical protein
MPELNFIKAYKLLQPTADRGLVDARNQGFSKILEKFDWPQIVDLTRLAFHLPYDATGYEDWFQTPLHGPDPHFFVSQDAAEAGRIATLILRHYVIGGKLTHLELATQAFRERVAMTDIGWAK